MSFIYDDISLTSNLGCSDSETLNSCLYLSNFQNVPILVDAENTDNTETDMFFNEEPFSVCCSTLIK